MGHYSDALNVARNMPNMTFPPALWQKYGRLVKSVVDVPVFLVGRINHPRTAEDLLEANICDAVVMARALIADPHLPEKARTGRTGDIRPCVGAMNCIDSVEHGRGIRCIHNPRVGHELDFPEEVEAGAGGKQVLVVGGGPAGLEAARVAAARGHRVTLLEKAGAVGGQVSVASRAPGRAELASIVEWLEHQCRANGVDIRTGQTATPETIVASRPDVVVIATGASYPHRPAPGGAFEAADIDDLGSHLQLVGLEQVLAGEVTTGRVVVYDAIADWPGFNAARVLAERGCEVRYVTPERYPGAALEVTNWRMEYQALSEQGVELLPVSEVVGSVPGGLVLRRGFARDTEKLQDVDTVVWIGPPASDTALRASLQDQAATILVVGDAYAPRTVEQAILDARLSVSSV
jgi:hypothetical protein